MATTYRFNPGFQSDEESVQNFIVRKADLKRVLDPLRAGSASAPRVLIVGDVPIPRVGVTTFVSGTLVRVVLEASEKVPFRVLQQEGKVTVSIPRDVVDVAFQQERLTGGIVEYGDTDAMFADPIRPTKARGLPVSAAFTNR